MTAQNHSKRYAVATLRGLTSQCSACGDALLSFDLEDAPCGAREDLIAQLRAGEPLRLVIGVATFRDLAQVLGQQAHSCSFGLCPICRTQPDNSCGKPTVDGSMQGGGQNV